MDGLERLLQFRFRVGRVADLDVAVHWTELLLVAWILWIFREAPQLGVLVVLVQLASVFLHELGHCVAARRTGGEAHEIILWPLGGLAMVAAPMTPRAQFLTAFAGPAVNLVLFAAALPPFLLLGGALTPLPEGGPFFLYAVVLVNGVLALLNLLPAYPMDGGRMFQAALWPWKGFVGAMRAAILATFVCAPLVAAVALWQRDMLLLSFALLIVAGGLEVRRQLAWGAYDDHELGVAPWADPGGDRAWRGERVTLARPPRAGWFARWRERRRLARQEEDTRRRAALRVRLDEVLAKVSAQGLDGLSREERRFLDEASRELRREQQGTKP